MKYFKYKQIEKIQTAWNLASSLHFKQTYINNQGIALPYINHLGAVVNEIYFLLSTLDLKDDYDVNFIIITAILHDTLEDTSITYHEIKKTFGISVANGVSALTKDGAIIDKKAKMLDSLIRIKAQPKEIAIVKMADRIVNLQPPPNHWDLKKRKEYYHESIIIYNQLKSSNTLLSERLLKKIETYKGFL